MTRKNSNKYYFSVEGETEKWYLEWLSESINSKDEASCTVKFDIKIEKNPLKHSKSISPLGPIKITHIFDMESLEDIHKKEFKQTLSQMKAVRSTGRSITYELGYTNFTFELWIILHKALCNTCISHRDKYLVPLNKAYGEKFRDLGEYKKEGNFKRILRKITLEDVKEAISRAGAITQTNLENKKPQQYKTYEYFEENPALSIQKTIGKIFKDCGL